MTTTRITGSAAIEIAARLGLTLSKYNDPIEDARDGLSVDEAREIAAQDPSLVYIDARDVAQALTDHSALRLAATTPSIDRGALFAVCEQAICDGEGTVEDVCRIWREAEEERAAEKEPRR